MCVSTAIRESTLISNGFDSRVSYTDLLSRTACKLHFGLTVSLDGGDASLTLETSTSGRLDSSLSSKRNSATSHDAVDVQNPGTSPQVKPCQLGKEILDQIPKRSMSEWIVDDTVMKSLLDDPQELVQCTSPYEKIILRLLEPVKLRRTIKIVHELEIIGEPNNAIGWNEDGVAFPTFTCPLEGPVFSINTSHFVATQLRIENCTKSSSKAAVIIESNSNATFNRTSFKEIKSRAIYIDQRANVTIVAGSFDGNEAMSGGGIYINDRSHVEIVNSTFKGNKADSSGGAIYAKDSVKLKVLGSIFSKNVAQRGGSIRLLESCVVAIIASVFSYNSAQFGGGIYAYIDNLLTLNNTIFSDNSAHKDGGGMYVNKDNLLTLGEATFSIGLFQTPLTSKTFHLYTIVSLPTNMAFVKHKWMSRQHGKEQGWSYVSLFQQCCHLVQIIIQRWRSSLFMALGNMALDGSSLFMGLNSTVRITRSTFLNNNATRHATVYASIDCHIFMQIITFTNNRATLGGCLYSDSSSLKVLDSAFIENASNKLGGCFHLKSSNTSFQNTTISQNKALEDGGGIFATLATILHMEGSSLFLNRAKSGGAVKLMLDSRLFCYNCTIKNNMAIRGGGCYIEGNVRQDLLAQMTSSNVEANEALDYGGGVVVKVFRTKGVNCFNASVPCGRVLLINSSFVGNFASKFRNALIATEPSGVLVACDKMDFYHTRSFMDLQLMQKGMQVGELKAIDPSDLCSSWQTNHTSMDPPRKMIGIFGHMLNMTINSNFGHQVAGDAKSGFVLSNLSSGQVIPKIVLTTLDASGNGHAPTFHDKAAIIIDSNGSFQHPTSVSFKQGSCTVRCIFGFVKPCNYTMRFKARNDDLLEAIILTLIVKNCTINEELTLEGAICSKCGEASYNFNLSEGGKCASCPERASCTGRYIVPIKGYWHKSPYHDKLKKCIVEEACNYSNRIQILTSMTQNSTNCNFNSINLQEYEETQCNEGYKGRLCGTCNKSYGRTSNFQCVKCGSVILSVLRLVFIQVCLFVTTIVAIKGTLPIASRCLDRQDAMTSTHEHVNTTPLEDGSSIHTYETPQEGSNVPQVTRNEEQLFSANMSSQLAHGIKIAHGNLVETWKD